MSRAWWYDSYWEKNGKRPQRSRGPGRKFWIWSGLVLLSLALAAAIPGFRPSLPAFLEAFAGYFCRILAFAIFVRVLLSWFRVSRYSWPAIILGELTEPVLSPLRRAVPSFWGLDLSPLIAIIALYLVSYLVVELALLFA
jgi:YggT family protein